MMYWAPPPAQLALSISYITYGDQLRMSVMADKNIVPNVDLLPELFTYEVPFSVPFFFSGKFFIQCFQFVCLFTRGGGVVLESNLSNTKVAEAIVKSIDNKYS